MLRISMQFFAHKKVWAPLKTAVIPNPNASAQKELTVSLFLPETFL